MKCSIINCVNYDIAMLNESMKIQDTFSVVIRH